MRFMLIHASRSFHRQVKPSPEVIEACLAFVSREVKAGRMVFDGGLVTPTGGARLRLGNGKVEVLDGPFAETKEVIGGFAVFELPDLDAALALSREFMDLHVRYFPDWEGTVEVRPIAGSMVEMVKGAASPAKATA